MRIIAGRFKGRPLATPPGQSTRPTSDRARESIFNILQHAPWAPPIEGARVLDLFAGSGAMGLEAISRGAAFGLFVETDEAARGAIRDNIDALGLFGCTRIHRRDATDLGPRPASAGRPFTLAFLDPPYGRGLGERALPVLAAQGWLAQGAVLVFERAAAEAALEVEGYEALDTRVFGAAQVTFLRVKT
jgi:16S rRNA (guanine966-N2)-methyltransferase